jgi:hypothetical protein
MKTTSKLAIVFCLAGAAAYAETWTGKLIDSSCLERFSTAQNSGKKALDLDKLDKQCAPTPATSSFAVLDGDKIYKLDSTGNSKVMADVYGGAIKADHDRDVHVTVTGKKNGDTIMVESVKGK